MFDYEQLISQLRELREESYAEFNNKLLPGTDDIWGIRLPQLRKVAKQIAKEDVRDYLGKVQHSFFEESMLMGFVIGTMKEPKYSLEEIKQWIQAFLPHIHNWSVCDSFCTSLKITKTEQEDLFQFLEPIFQSSVLEEKEFATRFVIVMWLNYYLKDEYVEKIYHYLNKIKSEQYYVNMAVAWCYSMIYISYPELVETFLNKNVENKSDLDSFELFVHNKTISKICESYQVEEERKKEIRSLRIRLNK